MQTDKKCFGNKWSGDRETSGKQESKLSDFMPQFSIEFKYIITKINAYKRFT